MEGPPLLAFPHLPLSPDSIFDSWLFASPATVLCHVAVRWLISAGPREILNLLCLAINTETRITFH